MSSLTPCKDGSLAVSTPFDRAFVDALKNQVPFAARKWHMNAKQWLIDPSYGPAVAALIQQYFGEHVVVPTTNAAVIPTIKLIQMLYLGRCKARNNGDVTASGYADGSWSLSFPEAILRAFFCDDQQQDDIDPDKPKSLYAILGIPAFSEAEAIKVAYRRMAKVWHPDVNHEDGATERFQKINHAYEVLKDNRQRRKYDVGLTLEMRATKKVEPMARYTTDGYRAPLCCGLLLVEGIERLGVLTVSNILKWDDIIDAQGRTMVSSWPVGAETFETRWI